MHTKYLLVPHPSPQEKMKKKIGISPPPEKFGIIPYEKSIFPRTKRIQVRIVFSHLECVWCEVRHPPLPPTLSPSCRICVSLYALYLPVSSYMSLCVCTIPCQHQCLSQNVSQNFPLHKIVGFFSPSVYVSTPVVEFLRSWNPESGG